MKNAKEISKEIALQCITTLASDYELHIQESFEDMEDEELWGSIMKEVGKRMISKENEIYKILFPKGMPKTLLKSE